MATAECAFDFPGVGMTMIVGIQHSATLCYQLTVVPERLRTFS